MHMHDLGTRINFVQTRAGVLQTLLDVLPYTVNAQLVYPLMPPAQARQDDQFQIRCSYVNNSGSTVIEPKRDGEQNFARERRHPGRG
jgi:hypothetical protein